MQSLLICGVREVCVHLNIIDTSGVDERPLSPLLMSRCRYKPLLLPPVYFQSSSSTLYSRRTVFLSPVCSKQHANTPDTS